MMMYHASIYRFDEFAKLPCFTDEPDAALGYLNGHAGHLYTVEIDEDALEAADEATVWRVAEELDLADGYSYVWEVLEDEPEVREALKERGYNAAEYTDLGPDNAYEHYTLLLLDPALARIVAVDEVQEPDEEEEGE